MNQSPPEATPPSHSSTKTKSANKPLIASILVIVALLGVVGLGFVGNGLLNNNKALTTIIQPETDGNETVTTEESNIAAVAEKVSPSVVSVMTETRTRSYYGTTTA